MGWSTRGAGRQYDSNNGFGAIIGCLSGLVLDYSTCNRKCRKCGKDGPTPEHNCRRNFYGSAKAMEVHVAKKIVVESEILRNENVEIGVLVGDDDSSTIAACRAAANHPIIKQSDVNHTSGGVKKKMYNIQKNHKELTKDCIIYLHRCFTYALAQNKGNSVGLANAVRSIPYHAFNDHTKCGSQRLFEELKDIFDKLASNAQKFSTGASSNANESLNATMASKAPKSRKENTEGITYETNCALLTEPAVLINEENNSDPEEDLCETPIILLDLETSGFQADCDILQIAAKCNKSTFTTYINPIQQISPKATEVHGLVNCYGDLMHNATHNLTFDGPRLFKAIIKNNLIDDFSMIIYGFIDTLSIIRKITGRKDTVATAVTISDTEHIEAGERTEKDDAREGSALSHAEDPGWSTRTRSCCNEPGKKNPVGTWPVPDRFKEGSDPETEKATKGVNGSCQKRKAGVTLEKRHRGPKYRGATRGSRSLDISKDQEALIDSADLHAQDDARNVTAVRRASLLSLFGESAT
nr:PREDICTED: uncharacterized protein LOC105670095 [Linepithema humile]